MDRVGFTTEDIKFRSAFQSWSYTPAVAELLLIFPAVLADCTDSVHCHIWQST